MPGLESAARAILRSKKIIVACHINPDGDCIGSMLSLGLGLKKLGKQVYLISADGVPKRYRQLPGADLIKRGVNKDADLVVAVDCNDKEMLGKSHDSFRRAKDILEIDHHLFRKPFGSITYVDTKAAAVGEQIYLLLKKMNVGIGVDIAQNILTSIIVETNAFRLPDTRPFTFRVCADLLEGGLDFYKLTDMIYWSRPKESVILSGICLSRCKFIKNGEIVWSVVRKKDFKTTKGQDEDVDSVAEQMRAIGSVKIAVFFREKNNGRLRVSIRSKGGINAAALARHYGGGGHFDIAGCFIRNSHGSMRDFLRLAETLLKTEAKAKSKQVL
ncbi:MAG: DHH family phosphoesterase [Candidatus Omnitrophica bacterium]|nr:DHH family phosphoesterase [Candidatus Omnitrophota bacterium]MDD5592766.1 DHH family phosphoesterase [Candidatus Omnitrophota bacterium]